MKAPRHRQKPRTCVGCREESPKGVLVRIVRSPDGAVVVDERGKLPGRGAYLCARRECLEKARKSGAIARALKTTVPEACYEELARRIEACAAHPGAGEAAQELCALLGLSRRSGMVLIGSDSVQSQCGKGALLILTAEDCSASVLKFAERLVSPLSGGRAHAHIHTPLSVERLSCALGTGHVQVIALPGRSGLADRIKVLLGEGGHALEQQNTGLRIGEDAGKEQ